MSKSHSAPVLTALFLVATQISCYQMGTGANSISVANATIEGISAAGADTVTSVMDVHHDDFANKSSIETSISQTVVVH